MSETFTIPKEKSPEPSLNYEFLRREGHQYIESLSCRIWTDCNTHDPGVKNAWLTARESAEIPIYLGWCEERLTVDEVIAKKTLAIKGFYDVLIELDDGKKAESAQILENVRARLMKNRNLCEDFIDITLVGKQNYILCAEIDVYAQAEVENVEAEVFLCLQRYLTPEVKFYSLHELLDRGVPVEEIFARPVLDRGFIDNQELEQAQLPKTIPLADIIRIVMGVESVEAVREIRLACQTACDESVIFGNPWNQEIAENTQVILNPDKSRLVYYKGHVPAGKLRGSNKTAWRPHRGAEKSENRTSG